ncbi:MAG: gephyrin-like molybdotransferase Glp [Pseudomonadota bacterium]
MIPVAEALSRLFDLMPVLPTEVVPLTEAAGRVLCEEAVARRTQPPFAASAMDGYAVRAAEAQAGQVLPVVGEAAAGHRWDGALPSGAAVRIFTGAPLPEGADSILIQENADRIGDQITVREAPATGAYVRPAGGDFRRGQTLSAPRLLTPRDVALLAAMNVEEVIVARRPIVALIPTGDELVLPGETPGPDQIVSSNNFGLHAMLTAMGAVPRLCPIARDTPESLRAALATAEGADVIVTLGGASVGDHDLVAEVLGSEGLSLDFYKVAMRPGKPLMAGQIGGAVMLGLPGNPVSAMVCGEVFLRPALLAAMGMPRQARKTEPAILGRELGPNGPREHYMRASLTDEGQVVAFDSQDSSLVRTLALSDVLLVRAPRDPPRAAGQVVQVIRL